jgi:hypothetical protein
LSSFDAFPTEHGIPPCETLKSSYLYGSFDFGEGFERMIFGYPLGDQCVSSSQPQEQQPQEQQPQDNTSSSLFIATGSATTTSSARGGSGECLISQVSLPIAYKSCILSGIKTEKLKFQDQLTSSTFILQIHTDDLCNRVFSSTHVQHFNENYLKQQTSATAVAEVTPKQPSPRGNANAKKNKKDASSSAAGAAAASASSVTAAATALVHPTTEPFQEKDEIVWNWITTALQDSSRLLSFGSVRCRLESILRTSTDRLLDFQAIQTTHGNSNSKDALADLTVVISVSLPPPLSLLSSALLCSAFPSSLMPLARPLSLSLRMRRL